MARRQAESFLVKLFSRLGRSFFLGALLAVAAQAQVSLIGYWKFDETTGATTLTDSGPNHFTGSLVGAGAWTSFVLASGVAGNALSLNAANQKLADLGNVLGLSGANLSVSFWIQTTQANMVTVLGQHNMNGGSPNGVSFFLNAGGGWGAPDKAAFYTSTPAASGRDPRSTSNIDASTWHQVVGIKTASNNYLYVDGSLQATTGTDALVFNTASFIVGGHGGGTTGYYSYDFTGLIDDLQVYSGALSASDVSFLYHNAGQAIPAPATYASLAGLGALGSAVWHRRRREARCSTEHFC